MSSYTKLKEMLEDAIIRYSKKTNNLNMQLENILSEISENESAIDDLQTEITETEVTIKKMKKYRYLQQKSKNYILPFFCLVSALFCGLPFLLEGTLNLSQIDLSEYSIFGVAELMLISYCLTVTEYYRKLNKALINPYTLEEEIEYLSRLYEKKADVERILGNNIGYKSHLTNQLEIINKDKETFEMYLSQISNAESRNANDLDSRNNQFIEIIKLVRTKIKKY